MDKSTQVSVINCGSDLVIKCENIAFLNTNIKMLTKPKIYSIKVSGIKCTNCAGKIKTALDTLLSGEEAKTSVNIMQQTVTLSSKSSRDLVPEVLEKLQTIGYPAIKQPLMLDSGQANERQLTIKVALNSETEKIQAMIKDKLLGIVDVNRVHEGETLKFKLRYNSEIVKGREIADFFQQFDKDYIVINERVEGFKSAKKIEAHQNSLRKTILLCAFFLTFNMFLPLLPGELGKFYNTLLTFPHQLKILSFSVLLNFGLSLYVFKHYTKPIVLRAYKNYRDSQSTDMQTLVSLGCLSAFGLFLLFIMKYGYEMLTGDIDMVQMKIMDINDALTSASIIVLVVNIGKYLEHKVKRKIQAMTQEIFPESMLFSQMKVEAIQLQNRLLKIKGKKFYDSGLLEKGDIISMNSLHNKRLLLDVILISGKIRAQQSTTTGCDEIIEFKKGDRIESGALIYESTESVSTADNMQSQCLAMVENVFEKSMLVQIGTQIKFSQNQEDDQKEGIQAVCKKIASKFVKGVIALSITTMVAWTLLIWGGFVHLEETCGLCWVVQRGIGVLVASCPCALGLAVPSVIAIVLNLATKSGILIKNNGVFEKMKITKKISFDKTGTLFTRINNIQEYHVLSQSLPQNQIWQIIALLQKQIRHPLAQILYKEAFERSKIQGTNFGFVLMSAPVTGKQGISAEIQSKSTKTVSKVWIGNKGILENNHIEIPKFERKTNAATELFLVLDTEVLLVMRLNTHSNLRPEAIEVIRKIMEQGEEVHILSGDSHESVLRLGHDLGIPDPLLHPEHSSSMKMQWIKRVQQMGTEGVMMIGDGLNDIPCLQESAIGVSINAKSELNINAADVVVLDENLYKILALIRMLKKGNLFIKINLFWAFAYNIVIMPIVAGVFYPWGFGVSPIGSSIAMSLSSIIVVSISHLLSFFNFDQTLKKNNKISLTQMNESSVANQSQKSVKTLKRKKDEPYIELMESN